MKRPEIPFIVCTPDGHLIDADYWKNIIGQCGVQCEGNQEKCLLALRTAFKTIRKLATDEEFERIMKAVSEVADSDTTGEMNCIVNFMNGKIISS